LRRSCCDEQATKGDHRTKKPPLILRHLRTTSRTLFEDPRLDLAGTLP
jgi:hypothetical protein